MIANHVLAGKAITLQVETLYAGPIQIDVESIQQAFMNLVYNARDAMPEGGVLTIRSRLLEDGMVQFEFIDTGCGMSADIVERLFDPFVTAGKPFGTGIGMTIVKEILDEHHGKIEVESVVNEGTTVRLILPTIQKP